jgi:hypothetical protein
MCVNAAKYLDSADNLMTDILTGSIVSILWALSTKAAYDEF